MKLRAVVPAAALLALAVGVAAVLTARNATRTRAVASGSHTDGDLPRALDRHLERLKQATPGVGGESENLGGAEAEKWMALAYPDKDVPLVRLQAARAAGAAIRQRGFAHGGGG